MLSELLKSGTRLPIGTWKCTTVARHIGEGHTVVGYDVIEARSFWDCVLSIRRDDPYRADLLDALAELRLQPFRNPRLQTHDVGKALNGKTVFSSDVGGRRSDRRLIWQIFNKTIVVLLYGTHAVQERAKRMRIAFDPNDRVVTVYEQAPDSGVERSYEVQRQQVGRLFMAWTDHELRAFGFPEHVVVALRSLDTDDELLALESSLSAADFERAFNLLAFGDPNGEEAARTVRDAEAAALTEATEPEPTPEDREIERELSDPRRGALFTRVEPDFLKEVLGRPIEDWMIFLHPDQRQVVTRHYEGPARVRGAAGTGKTVVGLHRASWLAERARERGESRTLLFTTFIKSLPPVLESLYLRMPGTRAGEVEFVNIDKLARKVCADAGDRVATDPRSVDAAFATAFKSVVAAGSPLDRSGFTRQYLRDEITAVIKGRGITDLDTYLALVRTGRQAVMGRQQRAQVWDLMLAWDAEMQKRGTVDFVDVVIRARDHARRAPAARYHAAIVDEAQDLTLVGLQLVRSLVNGPAGSDAPNGLLLLGDGAQRIYPGGFKLRQAGVEVRGRTTVLNVNYRNTREIASAALAVAGDGEIDDLGEEFRRNEQVADAQRRGGKPALIECSDFDHQLDVIVQQVQELTSTGGMGLGDIAVLVPTNKMVTQVTGRLAASDVAALKLDDYDGRPAERVKVGTYHRGKGLEFKAVLLPGLSKGHFPRDHDGHSEEEQAEARALAVSQLFVAMTRARDQLFVLFDGTPSDVLVDRLDQFELVTP